MTGPTAPSADEVLSGLPQAVVVQDLAGRITWANAAARALFGSVADGARFAGLLGENGEPVPEAELPWAAALRAGNAVRAVQLGLPRAAPGETRWLRTAAVPLHRAGAPAPTHVCTVFEDVTREKLGRDLRRAGRTLAELSSTCEDRTRYAAAVTRHFSEWTGCRAVALVTRDHLGHARLEAESGFGETAPAAVDTGPDLLGPAARLRFSEACADAGLASAVAVPITHAGDVIGELRLADLAAGRLVPRAMAFIDALVPFLSDALQRLNAEAAVEHSQAQLMFADRLTSMGTLAAGVAHEINNPLSYVISNLDYALAEISDGAVTPATAEGRATFTVRDDFQQSLRDARDGADRVRAIVRDLKSFSGSDDRRIERLDVQRTLESAVHMVWNELRHRGRLVKDHCAPVFVAGNEARLGQVFLNLLVNAVHALPEGQLEKNEVRLRTRLEGGNAVVEVSDTGCGIPEEARARIFEPFFTTKPVGVGTGLGLSICQTIVGALGGHMEVESQVGRGTTFRVVLPACPPEPAAVAPGTLDAARRSKILVIDDEPKILRGFERLLSASHDLRTTTSGAEALSWLRAGASFDVIFCDVMMPETSVVDLYADILEHAPRQAERVVFLSGGVFSPQATVFLEHVPNPRLEKPIDAAELAAFLGQRLG